MNLPAPHRERLASSPALKSAFPRAGRDARPRDLLPGFPSIRFPTFAIALGTALLVLGSTSCAGWRAPRPVRVTLPEVYLRSDSTGVYDAAPWWPSLGDALLCEIIDEAIDENLTLEQAVARLDQYRALQRTAGSTWFPTVAAQATAIESEPVEESSGAGVVLPGGFDLSEVLRESMQQPTYSVSLAASYEIDVWGRLAAGRAAATADLRASENDVEAVAIALAAQAARAYYTVVELQLQDELLGRTIASFEDSHELVATRYQRGVASLLDVYQAETSLAGARAQRVLVRGQLAQAGHALAVLLGRVPQRDLLECLRSEAAGEDRHPDSLSTGRADGEAQAGTLSRDRAGGDAQAGMLSRDRASAGQLPDSLPRIPAGLPSELLQRRPDVRSAYWRLRAADRRGAEAAAQRLPTLSLTGSLGGSSDELGEILDPQNMVWSAIGNLVLPVFEGGRRKANQDRAEAAWRGQVAAYKEAVLQALREVEDALVAESMQRDYLRELTVQDAAARNMLLVATDRYLKGLVDYLAVTSAQTAYFNSQRNRIAARRALLFARIGLLTALGGDWAEALHTEDSGKKE